MLIYVILLDMKYSLTKYWTYIFAIILSGIGIGVPFIVFGATASTGNKFQYPLLMAVFAATYLLVGFILGDIYIIRYRKKNDCWNDDLPKEIKDSSWLRRTPFYLSSLIIFLVFFVLQIIYWISGSYPLL